MMDAKISAFVHKLKDKELKVAFAESMTCGMLAEKLATCIGTSDVLAGSIVCYQPEVKKELFKVPQRMIDKYSCESMQVTELLAKNLTKLITADIYAAITGLAAPGGSESKSKPVGTVFFCVYYKRKIHKLKKRFRGEPQEIRLKACKAMYDFILRFT
jgi:nicotinamide-nucleotide amidase